MGHVAALLVLASQALLLWVVFEPSGRSAIAFSFLGHPLLGLGVLLGLWALTRRLRREAQQRAGGAAGALTQRHSHRSRGPRSRPE